MEAPLRAADRREAKKRHRHRRQCNPVRVIGRRSSDPPRALKKSALSRQKVPLAGERGRESRGEVQRGACIASERERERE